EPPPLICGAFIFTDLNLIRKREEYSSLLRIRLRSVKMKAPQMRGGGSVLCFHKKLKKVSTVGW
ncbi:MAG: hypothetical protein AAFR87_00005, partial [Bacteroidota bacterium]